MESNDLVAHEVRARGEAGGDGVGVLVAGFCHGGVGPDVCCSCSACFCDFEPDGAGFGVSYYFSAKMQDEKGIKTYLDAGTKVAQLSFVQRAM